MFLISKKYQQTVALVLTGMFTLGLLGCGVELRDKKSAVAPTNELVVENEYSVPIPLIQSQQMVLHYDRLVLRKGAKFITNGLNLRLEVGELDADEGTITTFPDNSGTPIGQNGRSGGNFEMTVENAIGKLSLTMRGENGGRGVEGLGPTAALKGPTGAKGRDCIKSMGYGPCFQGLNGEPGGAGLQGFGGGKGLKGGDSGTAFILIKHQADFNILISKISGIGGDGGPGGAGGAGGEGGQRGNDIGYPATERHGAQPPTYQGPQGPEGPQGPRGSGGANGIPQKVCLFLPASEPRCEATTKPTLNGEFASPEEIASVFTLEKTVDGEIPR